MPTTLAQLREQVKVESRVKGADNLDGFIDTVINEQLVNYAGKNRYLEFLKTNVEIATVNGVDAYALPEDFGSARLVRYRNSNGHTRTLNPRPQFIETANGTLPRWYDVAGTELKVFPFTDIPGGDTILIDYYAIPGNLAGSDNFPIPRIMSTVKLEAIRRVLIYNRELAEAGVLKGDAVELETRGRPTRG